MERTSGIGEELLRPLRAVLRPVRRIRSAPQDCVKFAI